jgi:hypothetical protein
MKCQWCWKNEVEPGDDFHCAECCSIAKHFKEKREASRGEKGDLGGIKGSGTPMKSRTHPLDVSEKPRNPESLTKDEEQYVKDSLEDIKAGRFEVSDRKETTDKLLRKLKRKR